MAKATYRAKEDCEVSFKKGDKLSVVSASADWLRVRVEATGNRGMCPVSYVDYIAPLDRASQENLLDVLDDMFKDTMASVDAEPEVDEEALAAAEALEAEFSFDNIMNEVLAEQAKIEERNSHIEEDGKDGFEVPQSGEQSLILLSAIEEAEMSSFSGRSSNEEDDNDALDGFFSANSALPKKPLPHAPEPEDVQDGQGSGTKAPILVTLGSASPRSMHRNLKSPSAVKKVSESSRTSSQPVSFTPTFTPKASPGMARSAARPVAKLLADDGTTKCAKCATQVNPDATFCRHCGSTLKQAAAEMCVACKLMLKPGVSVCGNCGTRCSSGSVSSSSSPVIRKLSPMQPMGRKSSPNGVDKSLRSPSPQFGTKQRAGDVPALSLSPRRVSSKTDSGRISTSNVPTTSLNSSLSSLSLSPRRSNLKNDRRSGTSARSPVVQSLSSSSRIPAVKRGSNSTPSGIPTRMILVGSGSSSGTPSLTCLANDRCKTCLDALRAGSKNRRRNPSLLIQHLGKNILIDAGKSFRESWVDVIELYKVSSLDAVVITHAHADAFFGLDDLREVIGRSKDSKPLPIYARAKDLEVIQRVFPYLLPENKSEARFVSKISFHVIPDKGAFEVCGLKMRGLPLPHGEDVTAMGFQFGGVVYMSDVSSIPENVFKFLDKLPSFEVLIIDALTLKREIPTHFNLVQALAVISRLKPKKAILTGMGHEINYEDTRRVLKKLAAKEGGLRVKPGFDMMHFSLDSNLF